MYEEVVEGGITRLAGDLQLARARPRRSGALGAQDRPVARVADRRRLRVLGRRAVRDRQHQHRAGRAARRDARRAADVPRPLARRAVEPLRARRPDVRASAARRSRRRRCSCTARRARRSAGRRSSSVHVGFLAGSRSTGPGTRRRHVEAFDLRPARDHGGGRAARAEERRRDVRAVRRAAIRITATRAPKRSSTGTGQRVGCSPAARRSRARGRAPTRPKPAQLLDAAGHRDPPHARPDVGRAARRRPTPSRSSRRRRRHRSTASVIGVRAPRGGRR